LKIQKTLKAAPLHIKNATVNDIPLIRTLTMQVWPQTYTPIVGEEQVNYMLARFYSPEALQNQMENGHQVIIGYDNDEPVTFASYSEIAPNTYKLHKLYIVVAAQGQGFGRHMIDHIVAALKSIGGTSLRLNVNIYNSPAMAFYKKIGFTHFGDEDIDIGNGYFMNDHILSLPIA
jgi:ribosomal protein S18 acetylase RimI-like enzyme